MSESVVNLLDRLERGLDDYAHHEHTVRAIKSLTNLEKELDLVGQKLGELSVGFAELDYDAADAAKLPVSDLAEVCRAAAGLIRQNRDAPQQHPSVETRASNFANDAEKAIREAWRDLINRTIPGWENLTSLADMLTRAHVDVGQVAALKQEVARVRDLSRRLPGEGSRADLTATAQTLRSAIAVLVGDDQDDAEVPRFLRGVAAGGAHVNTLAPGVLAWMRGKGIEGSFKIVLGRPADDR